MMKRKFSMDEVINLTENCYSVGSANWLRAQLEDYVTVDDVADLCDLREIGFENVRWVSGCWIAEKNDNNVNGDKHGGMMVCLSERIKRMLNDFCERENRDENVRTKNKVEILMYDLHDSLDKWNGNNMRNVNRIILVLEDLVTIFKMIRDKQYGLKRER